MGIRLLLDFLKSDSTALGQILRMIICKGDGTEGGEEGTTESSTRGPRGPKKQVKR